MFARVIETHRNVVTFSSSPSSICECFSTKKFKGKSTASANACSKSVDSLLNSVASMAISSRNPGKGCKFSHVKVRKFFFIINLLHPETSSWAYRCCRHGEYLFWLHQNAPGQASHNRCCHSRSYADTVPSSPREVCKSHLIANKRISARNEIRVLCVNELGNEWNLRNAPFHR